MRTFAVEDDLVEMIWAKAKPEPFEQLSFSDALRRVLYNGSAQTQALPPAPSGAKLAADSGRSLPPRSKLELDADALLAELDAMPDTKNARKGRAPKADLRELVRLGYLNDGQELIFVDFRGDSHPKGKAKVSGGELLFLDGKRYSMSALAGALLKQQGYVAEAVRGPEHWRTSDGRKVREIWEQALATRRTR
jgi:hypothetical protein